MGLKPVIRRVWAPVGKRPVARFKRGYEWTYLYGFVHPQSGEVFWLILPTVNTESVLDGLGGVRQRGGSRRGASISFWWWTRPAGTREARSSSRKGYTLSSCPHGSPELQPAERLWPLTNEAIANGLFEEIEEIEEALVERCVELLDQAETIRDLTNYHWWPQAA